MDVSPAEGGAVVRFYIDDKPAGGGLLAAEPFSSVPGACSVAGPGGFAAVYDELRVLRGAYRITSYNVCYTKLLRTVLSPRFGRSRPDSLATA